MPVAALRKFENRPISAIAMRDAGLHTSNWLETYLFSASLGVRRVHPTGCRTDAPANHGDERVGLAFIFFKESLRGLVKRLTFRLRYG